MTFPDFIAGLLMLGFTVLVWSAAVGVGFFVASIVVEAIADIRDSRR